MDARSKFSYLTLRVFRINPNRRRRLLAEAHANSVRYSWPNRPLRKSTAAVWADIAKFRFNTSSAECTFIRANHRLQRIRR